MLSYAARSFADCIEAGLPYDWSRIGIDPEKEQEIVRALLAAAENHLTAAAPPPPPLSTTTDAMVSDTAVAAVGNLGGVGCGDTTTTAAGATALGRGRVCLEETDGGGSRPATVAAVARTGTGAGGLPSACGRSTGADPDGESQLQLSSGLTFEQGGQNPVGGDNSTIAGVVVEGEEQGPKGASEIGRWDSVRLKAVKEQAPNAEYWEIRMVLARIKSGWRGYNHLF